MLNGINCSTKVQKTCTEYETPSHGTVPVERLLKIILTQILTLDLPNIPKNNWRGNFNDKGWLIVVKKKLQRNFNSGSDLCNFMNAKFKWIEPA